MLVGTGGLRRLVVVGGAVVAALFVLFVWSVGRAGAAELLLWDNYEAEPASISVADGLGQGGGPVNLGSQVLETPEGMAYDTVTNRLFVPSTPSAMMVGGTSPSHILSIDLGGGGATSFSAPGAAMEGVSGIAIDPTTRTLYWLNDRFKETETISWAKLDGSGGGTLSTPGATLEGAYRLTIDPLAGRLYWANTDFASGGPGGNPASISWASVNGSGGGNLDITGATPTEGVNGIAVDPAAGKVYWLNSEAKTVSYANLNGSGGGDLSFGSVPFDQPYGLAIDSAQGKISWANYGNGDSQANALGFGHLAGGGGGLSPNVAPVSGPQDLLIIKSPTATAPPTVARVAKAPASLTCTTGAWAADLPGGNLYQAPRTYAYQWSKNGVAIPGAVATTLATTAKGSYACTVTAANQAGAGVATASAATSVTAAKAKLTLKKKLAKAKPGKAATFKVTVVNQGDLATGKSAKLCAKVPKSLKKVIKAGCARIGGVKGLAKKVAKLKVKVKPTAQPKNYSLKIAASGVASKPLKVKLRVLG